MDLANPFLTRKIGTKESVHFSYLPEDGPGLTAQFPSIRFHAQLARVVIGGGFQGGTDWSREDTTRPWLPEFGPRSNVACSGSCVRQTDWHVDRQNVRAWCQGQQVINARHYACCDLACIQILRYAEPPRSAAVNTRNHSHRISLHSENDFGFKNKVLRGKNPRFCTVLLKHRLVPVVRPGLPAPWSDPG